MVGNKKSERSAPGYLKTGKPDLRTSERCKLLPSLAGSLAIPCMSVWNIVYFVQKCSHIILSQKSFGLQTIGCLFFPPKIFRLKFFNYWHFWPISVWFFHALLPRVLCSLGLNIFIRRRTVTGRQYSGPSVQVPVMTFSKIESCVTGACFGSTKLALDLENVFPTTRDANIFGLGLRPLRFIARRIPEYAITNLIQQGLRKDQ